MVVHGGCFENWLDDPYTNHVDLTDHYSMAGKAVLICRPNSHPFVDRTLSLDHPVKIGRSVARARAAQTNGIFDCKVLSRNHALIWYSNGKFYLQDTKSSNGTFVNNQRLSKSGEDSSPREVSSGDIVQFGVDVLENARKVTHGCIVANLKLYLPDGKEAKASPSTSFISSVGSISLEDLYQLNQHIQEALQREQMLQTKLAILQQLVLSLKQAADLGWKALIAEDRLLSRVEILESQLQTYGKNVAEDKLREELRKLQEEKSVYQGLSKECLQKVLQEKLEAVQKCQDIERSLLNAEQECTSYKEMMERNREELQDLASKNNTQMAKIAELQNQLEDTKEDCTEALSRVQLENEILNSEMDRMLENETVMQKKIKQLEASGKIVGLQLLGIQSQFKLKRSPDIHDEITSLKEQNGDSEDDVICKNNDEEEELKEDNQKDVNCSMDALISRLTSLVDMQSNFKELIVLTQAQISLLQEEKMSKLQQINSLETKISLLQEEKMSELQQINSLEEEVIQREEKLYKCKEENKDLEETQSSLEDRYKQENTNNLGTTLNNSKSVNGTEKLSNSPEPANTTESLQTQIDVLNESIKGARSKVEAMEETINLLQEDLSNSKKSLSETTKNWLLQEEKLQKALTIKEHGDTTVSELCEHLKSIENSLMQAKLQEKIELESEHINKHKEEATLLRKQLLEAQQTAKQNKNEAELVKEKLRAVCEELEIAKSKSESSLVESQLDNKAAEELIAARLEAAAMEAQVVSLEAQIKKLKTESNQKQHELEESSQAGTGTPGDKEAIIEKLGLRVNEMEEELVLVKEKYMACNEKNTQLEKKFSSLRQDYEAVIHQPYFNVVFALPLLILFIAMTIAFHPTLASLMGTLDSWPDT